MDSIELIDPHSGGKVPVSDNPGDKDNQRRDVIELHSGGRVPVIGRAAHAQKESEVSISHRFHCT